MSDVLPLAIRPLAGPVEYRACLALQRLVWGQDFTETVPPSLLWAAQHTGGQANGAFTPDGELAGFTFGFTGIRGGGSLHWLDMLAVHPVWRGRGVAYSLLCYLRAQLLPRAIAVAEWTFEPLEAGNAWLYLHRLGATAGQYLRNVYGEGDSPLHSGIGTDRLLVHWKLDNHPAEQAPAGSRAESGGAGATVLNDVAWGGEWPRSTEPRLDLEESLLRLRVPAAIQALKAAAPGLAAEWRRVTRAALEHYLGRGWLLVDLLRPDQHLGEYLLRRS